MSYRSKRAGKSARRGKASKRGFFTKRSKYESRRITWDLARHYHSQCGQLGRQLDAAMASEDHAFLINFEFDYSTAVDPREFVNLRRLLALFQKNKSFKLPGVDREAAAWESFSESEILCSQTNARFESYESGTPNPRVEPIIMLVQRKIAQILGPCPLLEDLHFGFGPGANTTCRKRTSARHKLATPPVCSREALHSVNRLMSMFPAYRALFPSVAIGNGELSFVPKNAKTNRTIMIEPILNTFVQRGIGRYIKRRLVHYGCNLYDQSVNRQAAMEGSLTGSLVTLDLSSASDLIAHNVVATLLPPDWYELLVQWRTGRIEYKKKGLVFELEKFSSMGNGFTFELESLIFYALALVTAREVGSSSQVSVYGDDIIVGSDAADLLIERLELFGFKVNTKKSCLHGPFRESCGGDYLSGLDIRPFYCKDTWTDARITACHNQIYNSGFDDREARAFLVRLLPAYARKSGPPGYGDGHLHGSYIGVAHKRDQGYEGFIFSTFVKKPLTFKEPLLADYLLPSYLCYQRDIVDDEDRILPLKEAPSPGDPYQIRGGEKVKVVRIYTLAPSGKMAL